VVADGLVRPAGQLTTQHIGADRLTLAGVTGRGRSVAVVDSGLDLSHPDFASLGAIPGWNVAENNANLSDCSGHGTAVAGVVAGPQGVAPEAGLVVLKVFGPRDGCRNAAYSDVLAAVDWAVTNRDLYGIDAINLSLADEKTRAGFCDAEDPPSTALFAAARAAGIAVVAAAGNDGKATGLPWPACLSDVASAGMVYSASVGATAWGPPASCQDAQTGPDLVPCASNTGSALSLLTPGYGWTTPAAGGGDLSNFGGTSAAAPALTGAVLLARQSRPILDPALATDLLRATGAPVLDARAKKITPRVDLGAAFDAVAPVTGGCPSSGIPDGSSDGLVCEAFASSIVGKVSTIAVALSIDHPDPTHLVVTLTGPDGASAVLMNRSGRAGEAVREVFGRTVDPVEPLSGFAGREAAGSWLLKVIDTVPGGAGRLVSWAIQIEPEAPPEGPTAPFATAVLPTAARGAGRFGAFFTTDVRIFNSDAAGVRTVGIRYAPASGVGARTLWLNVPPRGTRPLNDVLGNAFRTSGYGPVFLTSPRDVAAAARISTTSLHGGTFGLVVPSLRPEHAAGLGTTLVLLPPVRRDGARINVGVTEVAGIDANVEIAVKDGRGAAKGVVTETVPGGSLLQVNDVYAATGATPDESDRIDIRVVSGGGHILGFATSLDNRTNDGAFSTAAVSAADVLLPGAARAAGNPSDPVQTDLKIANPGSSPISVRATFSPSSGPQLAPVLLSLGPGETRVIADVLGGIFSARDDAAGTLRLTVLEGGALVASARTHGAAAGGGWGLTIEPSPEPAEAPPGRRLALPFLSGSERSLTGVGFLETSGTPTHARIALHGPTGVLLAAKDLTLKALEAVEWSDLFAALGVPPSEDASAVVEVLDGGTLAAHAIVTDVRSGDASLFSGVLLP
jgi:subtilisin-like proprotein convertase family protein